MFKNWFRLDSVFIKMLHTSMFWGCIIIYWHSCNCFLCIISGIIYIWKLWHFLWRHYHLQYFGRFFLGKMIIFQCVIVIISNINNYRNIDHLCFWDNINTGEPTNIATIMTFDWSRHYLSPNHASGVLPRNVTWQLPNYRNC